MFSRSIRIASFVLVAGFTLWLGTGALAQQAKKVDAAQLRKAPAEEWLSYGRDQSETHFSPLKQIDSTNVGRLGLAFASDVEAPQGNIQGTPIMANGTVYTSFAWGVISATDARTGKFKWRWDPELPRTGANRPGMCCGAVNRGVAIYNGRIYASLIFGRLVALDAETGKEIWSTQTTDPNTDMTITGAVRIVKGKVIVGTAGAEFGVRGYFSAYDAETGKLAWRFYTTPGANPETPELKKAAETWIGTDWSKVPGGGTVWDGMAYDPDADLLYIGTGNGSPWNRQFRSPGGGDNLYLASILAVKPDTGKLSWYFQTTPGESWDYTSVQSMILADLRINGKNRKVIMQAPKNGFFYVLDRVTGEFISGQPYTEVNWAKGLDAKGRPIENPGVRYENGATVEIAPGSGGGHNWQPMAFSPVTGLVYIPGSVNSRMYHSTPDYAPQKGKQLSGVEMNDFAAGQSPAGARISNKGNFVKAWDPVTQQQRWSAQQTFSAGLLVTGGNLVFVPGGDGHLIAYSADKGEKVWDSALIAGIATPISYQLDGKQYIAAFAGRGGNQPTRLYTFMLDGTAAMPPAPLPAAGKAKAK
jgi:quinohemoprotein ethanol dehydrogenase